jgi:hypothetical protein
MKVKLEFCLIAARYMIALLAMIQSLITVMQN